MNYTDILTRVEHAGVYHMPLDGETALVTAAQENGYSVSRINLSSAEDKPAMLDLIGKSMHFPDWFGHNWDALLDCLADLNWQAAEGHVVILEHCDHVHGMAETDFVQLLQVFEAAANEWREQGIPFWCFVDMQADGINWLSDIG